MSRRAAALDAGLYGGSALISLAVAAFASIPLQRQWGRLSAGPYAVGAVLSLLLARRGPSSGVPDVRTRAWLAALVLFGAAFVPLALESVWRAGTDPGMHAQSEAIVTEEAARALRHGHDPYAADFSAGPLAERPLGTRTHFPYLPLMLIFGLPRAIDGSGPITDARVAFAICLLGAAGAALAGRGPAREVPGERRLLAFQVLAVLPTGALLMATGGDDLPVLAFMLLSLLLARSRRPVAAGLAAGAAAAMKQTAWPLLFFLALAARDKQGRRGWPAFLASSTAVVAVLVVPFALWNMGAFIEDVIRFPLGLGRQGSAAETPTIGSALVRAFPAARVAITVGLVGVALALAAFLLVRGGPRTVARAARHTGLALMVAFVLAPAARLGYLIYPANLLVWAWLLGGEEAAVGPGAPAVGKAAVRNNGRTARSRPGGAPGGRSSPG